MTQNKSVFDSFTNLYSLSKTLRFELIPTPETESSLKQLNLLDQDANRAKNYKKIKPFIDMLHRRFIDESMKIVTLTDLNGAFDTYLRYRNATKEQKSKSKKEWLTVTKILRAELCKSYNICATNWIEKYPQYKKKTKETDLEDTDDIESATKAQSWEILKKEATLTVLVDMFKESHPEIVELIKEFKGFYTSLAKLIQTRSNIYSTESDATSLSNRLIDENIAYFFNAIIISRKYSSSGIFTDYLLNLEVDSYAKYLTQQGIDDINSVIAELNTRINIFNQSNPDAEIPHIHALYKQILSEKEDKGYGGYESDTEANSAISKIHDDLELIHDDIDKLCDQVLDRSQWASIFISSEALNTISLKYFTSWTALSFVFESDKMETGKKTRKGKEFISLQELHDGLCMSSDIDDLIKQQSDKSRQLQSKEQVFQILTHLTGDIRKFSTPTKSIPSIQGTPAKPLLDEVRQFAENAVTLDALLRYFALEKKRVSIISDFPNADSKFYTDLDRIRSTSKDFYQTFNLLRNYLTKKPYSIQKMKLYFGKATLAGGWSANDEGNLQFQSTILRKNDQYYLAVLTSGAALNTKSLAKDVALTKDYQIMNYVQLKSQSIYGSMYHGTYHTSYADDKTKMTDLELIARIKSLLKRKEITFPQLQEVQGWSGLTASEFAIKLNELSLYSLQFGQCVSEEYLRDLQLEADSKLFIFHILNKDLRTSTSREHANIHTTLFRHLFEPGTRLKLQGQAEIFKRPKTEKLPIKRDTKGNEIKFVDHQGLKREVIEHRRYSVDKYFFHVPVLLNFARKMSVYEYKDHFRKTMNVPKQSVRFIGLDRGENNLIYYSVITQEGVILEQGPINKSIDGKTDYLGKLVQREGDRQKARKEWDKIGSIKDLKSGYLSQAVRKVCDLLLQYQAIVVLEALNSGFKRGRQKIERSIYTQFETALATKLMYLFNKKNDLYAAAGAMNALQLAPLFGKMSDFEKSNVWGFIWKVPPAFTSITDPRTGFNFFSCKIDEPTKAGLIKFVTQDIKSIFYKDGRFSIDCNGWRLCTHVSRWVPKDPFNKNYQAVEIRLSARFCELFKKMEIEFEGGTDIRDQIIRVLDQKTKTSFHTEFIYLWRILLQLRNKSTNDDFIASPVHPFFDSREVIHGKALPENADANGAYNIAVKALVMYDKLKIDLMPSVNIEEFVAKLRQINQ